LSESIFEVRMCCGPVELPLLSSSEPQDLAWDTCQHSIGAEQHQIIKFGLGGQHAIKGVAMGLVVAAGSQSMDQRNRQDLKAISLQRSGSAAMALSSSGGLPGMCSR
jgi:hypothetical protein